MFPIHCLWKNQQPILLVLTAIFLVGRGFTWFEAQEGCRANGKTIVTVKDSESNKPYWTKYYKRRSHWIGTLGCYSNQDLSSIKRNNFSLNIPSAGLCQERCSEGKSNNFFYFALQNKVCICLNGLPEKSSSPYRNCKYSCMSGAGRQRRSDCGGVSAYSVFFSLTIQEDNSFRTSTIGCLGITCDKTSEELSSNVHNSGTTLLKEKCKHFQSQGEVFQDDISEYEKICDIKRGQMNDEPNWIEFLIQNYTSSDRGNEFSRLERTRILTCQRCRNTRGGCRFINCESQVEEIVCSKTTITENTKRNTALMNNTGVVENKSSLYPNLIHTTNPNHQVSTAVMNQQITTQSNGEAATHKNGYSTNMMKTSVPAFDEKEEDIKLTTLIQIGAPVLSVIISTCLVCILIRFIRRRQNVNEKGRLETRGDSSSPSNIRNKNTTSSKYAAMKNTTEQNFSQECTYNLTDNKFEKKTVYNEGEDSNYDHLGNSFPTKYVEEDTYNHLQIESESSYSTFTRRDDQREINDNTYDHADFQNKSQTYASESINLDYTDGSCEYSKAQKRQE